MTSTPVKGDVQNVLLNMTSPSVQQKRAENNFSDVLQKQSQPSETDACRTRDASAHCRRVEKQTAKVRDGQDTKKAENGEGATDKADGQALEAVMTLAEQLVSELAQQLGIGTEDVQELLGELGMSETDLLQPGSLMQVLLAAGGENDSLSLLTNEKLYASFQKLNETLQTGLEQLSELTGMETAELEQLLQQAAGNQTEEMTQETAAGTDATVQEMQQPEKVPETPIAETDADETVHSADRETSPKETAVHGHSGEDETVSEENPGSQMMLERSRETKNAQDGSHQQDGHANLFTQHMQQPELQQAGGIEQAQMPESYFSAETRQIMDQILDFMKVQTGDGLTQLEMQLHPESLGTLQIHIASKGGVVTAQFTAQNEAVKAALETQMVQLKETFQEQGVKVEAIEVTVQSHTFEQNLEQGRQNAQTDSRREGTKTKVRRLNLRDPEGISQEDMDAEDRLAAEMLAQNGNTVDYTA